jgi:hypothetical protein
LAVSLFTLKRDPSLSLFSDELRVLLSQIAIMFCVVRVSGPYVYAARSWFQGTRDPRRIMLR